MDPEHIMLAAANIVAGHTSDDPEQNKKTAKRAIALALALAEEAIASRDKFDELSARHCAAHPARRSQQE